MPMAGCHKSRGKYIVTGGDDVVHRLARTHTLLVVGVAHRGVVAGKALQTLALPGQRAAPEAERVADNHKK